MCFNPQEQCSVARVLCNLLSSGRGTDELSFRELGQESTQRHFLPVGLCTSHVLVKGLALELKISKLIRFSQAAVDANDTPIFVGLERQGQGLVLANK